MIAGTASADCGILVVAATTGEFEAGFAKGGGNDVAEGMSCGHTREHAILSRGLGVQQFVMVVKKLDAADPPWCRDWYMHIMSRVLDFLKDSGYREKQIKFVPVSGLTGVNVNRDDESMGEGEAWKALREWYKGPTLVEALDRFNPAKRKFEKPFRVTVTDVSVEGKYMVVWGRVAQGFVQMGDTLVVLPVGNEATVTRG